MASRLRVLPRSLFLHPQQRSIPTTHRCLQVTSIRKSSTHHPNEQREAQKDREKMDTQANEYSKSGTDSEMAKQDDAAFNPNSPNDPEEAMKVAGKGNKVNPLDASPANPELSKGTSESDASKKNK